MADRPPETKSYLPDELPIAAFIGSLTEDELDSLYCDTASVRFVFRLLDPMAQQIAMRFVFAGPRRHFMERVLLAWCGSIAKDKYTVAMQNLRNFRILTESMKKGTSRSDADAANAQPLIMNANFQQQMSAHVFNKQITSSGATCNGNQYDLCNTMPSFEKLRRHALESWDNLLAHLIASSDDKLVSREVEDAIIRLGLKSGHELTSLGFRFVLYERGQQIWSLVLGLLQEARSWNQCKLHIEPLRIVLGFADAKVGQNVNADAKLPYEQKILQLLSDIGALLRVVTSNGLSFFATPALLAMFRPIASTLLSRSVAGGTHHLELPSHLYEKHGHHERQFPSHARPYDEEYGIVVESNFKVYAYTSSLLQARLLEYFCRVTSTLPNLVVGSLSPESVLKAFRRGIQAEHIIRYLESAAHPRALQRREHGSAIVPDNVRGQLEVWESNRARTSSWKAVRISWKFETASNHDFERARQYSSDDGSLLWCREAIDGKGALLIVTEEGAERLRRRFDHGQDGETTARRVRARLGSA